MNQVFKVDEILNSKNFSEFYLVANEFCEFIENSKNENDTFLIALRDRLLKLYSNGIRLQWVDLQTNEDYNDVLDKEYHQKILSFVAEQLGENRFYWHVFNPSNHDDTEAVCGDLLDDIGDIYKDLKYSILIFNLEKNDCKEIALWQFKFYFDKHWSYHCINALNCLHYQIDKFS